MADTHHTLGHRFAGREFSDKSYTSHSTDQFVINNEPYIKSGNDAGPVSGPDSGSTPLINAPVLDTTLAELMETLRLHIHDVLRLPLPVQTRSRLVRAYCDIESRVKEMRLLLNPVDIAAALELLDAMQNEHGVTNSP